MAWKERNPYCDDCFFYKEVWGTELRCCHYLLITDHKRPCDPGVGCTVKVKEKKPKRKRKGTMKHGKAQNVGDVQAIQAQ